jgi:hypothetical protein
MSIDVMKQALEFVERNTYGGDDVATLITALRTAIEQAEKQEPVAIDPLPRACNLAGVDYQTYLKIKAYMPVTPAAPVQERTTTENNGGKTGWPPGLLQDDNSRLSKWFASKPDARQKVRDAAAPVQEPVKFLANGTRFKISYDSRQSGGQIHGIPPELGGRWVAFVAAEDDCHLKLTTPPAAPVQEPDYETLWHKVWPDAGSFVRVSADDLTKFAKAVSATPPAAQRQDECVVCGDKVRVIPRSWVGLDASDWFEWWRTAKVLGHTQAEIDFADFLLIATAVQDVLEKKNGEQT